MVKTLILHHAVDARHARNLGEQSVSSNIQAVIELLKNSYDADALECSVHFFAESQHGELTKMEKIVVEDNGIGMTVEDVENKWMRVATPDKIERPRSPVLGRIVAGDKGMGRFASQRLGNKIKIFSNPKDYHGRKKSKFPLNTLELTIDWNNYIAGKNFESIPNQLRIFDTAEETHGFRIEVTDLNGTWSLEDVDKMMVNAGTLISPKILKGKGDNSFKVKVVCHNFTPIRDDVESIIEKYAPLEIRAQILGNKVNYQIFSRDPTKDESRKPASDISKRAIGRGSIKLDERNLCGNAKINLLVFGDRPNTWAPKAVLKMHDLELQLEENCGIKIFNDGIRIMPYGNKGNDWLELDKRWLHRAGGKVRNRNVIGTVSLTREENTEIIETTTREGLVQNDAFLYLTERLVIAVLNEVEKYRAEVKREEKERKKKIRTAALAVSEIKQLRDFVETLDLRSDDRVEAFKKLNFIENLVEKQEKESKKIKEEATSKKEMYRNLSSLGISALAFHHEIKQHLGRIGSGMVDLVTDWAKMEEEDKIESAKDAREDALSMLELNKYIREFAALFRGVKGTRRKREEINFEESIENFKKGFKRILGFEEIKIEAVMGPSSFSGLYLNKASWESIMLNLFSNSIKALGQVERNQKYIRVNFEKDEIWFKISVRDNGIGIEQENFERIFDELWTTYKSIEDSGTGMGMTIVREIITEDYGGEIEVKSSTYEKENPGRGGNHNSNQNTLEIFGQG